MTSCAPSRASASRRGPPRSTRRHEFPWDVVELYREQGIFGLLFDEEHGGTGTGTLLALIAIEEVSKVCATSGLLLAVQELGSLGSSSRARTSSDRGGCRALPRAMCSAAYALTEAGSGSDSAAMRTTARRDGDGYVLDGSKRFITNAGVAGLYTVFAKTDPEAGHAGHLRVPRRGRHAGVRGGAARGEDGHLRLDDGRARVRRLPDPRSQSARRGGRRGSSWRCGSSTARGRRRRAGARDRAGRHRLRARVRQARARRWASRSPSTS